MNRVSELRQAGGSFLSMKTSIILAVSLLPLLPSVIVAQGGDWITDFDNHIVPMSEILSGGPPKDGIPAIDNPRFVTVEQADDWIGGSEPVAVVQVGDIVRVYPLQILIWHEIVNDRIGNTPLSVTFCPLCNTTLAFDRRFDGRVLDFGTTGRLRNSDLVMYDRQTETWWQQATGQGLVGRYAGQMLKFIAAPVVSWRDVKENYPSAQVLSRETGYNRAYGRNPYAGYDRIGGSPMRSFFRRALDRRLDAMERVVTVTTETTKVAYPFNSLARRRVVNDEVGGEKLVIFWAPGTSSALDSRRIKDGRDVGAGAAYSSMLDGRQLSFEAAGDGRFRDRETGSEWNILGRAVSGSLQGRRLEPVPHGNNLWFAWAAFAPETEIRD